MYIFSNSPNLAYSSSNLVFVVNCVQFLDTSSVQSNESKVATGRAMEHLAPIILQLIAY